MKSIFRLKSLVLPALLLAGFGALLVPASLHGGTSQVSVPDTIPADSGLDGQKLWSENCTRCHNTRSPEQLSDKQWETVVQHMRVRASLTGPEARAIVEFLKSAN